MSTSIIDPEGVIWSVHVEERREAVLSIKGSDHQVDRLQYLVFVSEFGKRRRSKDPAPNDWEQLAEHELRELLKNSVGLRSLSR